MVLSEKQSRKNIIDTAKLFGCERDVIEIFNKYDNLLKNCTNEKEKKAIATMGILEIHKLLSNNPEPISIDGKVY